MTLIPKWIDKAKETYRYHRSKLLSDQTWNTVKTAKALRRSMGSISEDLMIAKFCRENEEELLKFKYAYEGIEYIREKQKEEDMRELA